jgi:hypothetical protein
MQETAQYFEKRVFNKQVLDLALTKLYATHRKNEILLKSLVSGLCCIFV